MPQTSLRSACMPSYPISHWNPLPTSFRGRGGGAILFIYKFIHSFHSMPLGHPAKPREYQIGKKKMRDINNSSQPRKSNRKCIKCGRKFTCGGGGKKTLYGGARQAGGKWHIDHSGGRCRNLATKLTVC